MLCAVCDVAWAVDGANVLQHKGICPEDWRAFARERSHMMSGMLVGLALGSIIVFSVILITAALMMRGQWNDLARRPPAEPPERPPRT